MCGIAGILSAGRPLPELLRAMGDAIAHRGPDDRDEWIEPDAGVGFAHRRLAILDLSPRGHQPMASADGRHVLSYNGEIYNHTAIRRELEEAGATPEGGWRGHSDTETLLQAIAHWGLEDALAKAVGMFAFSLWDARDRTVSLVRDRFGEKPLYYGWAGRDLVFASELKSIRAHPGFDATVDRRALALFASRTNVPAPWSIYRGIFKLEPGCILKVSCPMSVSPLAEPPTLGTAANGLKLARYWSYGDVVRDGLQSPIDDRATALRLLDRQLGQAISEQSIADVPVGAFLSGGIDSSTITALYRKYGGRVRTFTIGFEEAGFDEAVHARAVAAHLGTEHHEHVVTVGEARDVIPLLPAIYDEPFADSSQIPTFLVSRFARQSVTVALTGDGGDELFGGYNRHVTAPGLWRRLERLPMPLRRGVGQLGSLPPAFWNRAAAWLPGRRQPHFGAKLQKALRIAGSARDFDDVYRSYLDEWSAEPAPVIGGPFPLLTEPELGVPAPVAVRTMYRDAIGYLPDDILCKVDRASMAVSLETRVPFLDHRVAELAARIPLDMKIEHGIGKRILRDLLGREVPASLFDRPKAGFAVPIGDWLRGPLRDWAEDLLEPAAMGSEGYFDARIVERRWRDHLDGRRDSTAALWAILMFQAWLRA